MVLTSFYHRNVPLSECVWLFPHDLIQGKHFGRITAHGTSFSHGIMPGGTGCQAVLLTLILFDHLFKMSTRFPNYKVTFSCVINKLPIERHFNTFILIYIFYTRLELCTLWNKLHFVFQLFISEFSRLCLADQMCTCFCSLHAKDVFTF